MESVVVKMGDIKVSKERCSIICYGLGSCVGLFLHDPITKTGGGAHIMFPEQNTQLTIEDAGFYAKEAIGALIEQVLLNGGIHLFLQAKLVGGANVFIPGEEGIGYRIVRVIMRELLDKNIPVVAKDVGGHSFRTARFFVEDGRVEVKSLSNNNVLQNSIL